MYKYTGMILFESKIVKNQKKKKTNQTNKKNQTPNPSYFVNVVVSCFLMSCQYLTTLRQL